MLFLDKDFKNDCMFKIKYEEINPITVTSNTDFYTNISDKTTIKEIARNVFKVIDSAGNVGILVKNITISN